MGHREGMVNATEDGNFHCFLNASGTGCDCMCNKHPECCSLENKILVNRDVLDQRGNMKGNRFYDIESKQDCCNMCTNHPLCSLWEWTDQNVCVLDNTVVTAGAFTDNPDSGVVTTWAGTADGSSTSCIFSSTSVSMMLEVVRVRVRVMLE